MNNATNVMRFLAFVLALAASNALKSHGAERLRFITEPLDIEIEETDRRGDPNRPTEVYHQAETRNAKDDPEGNWGEPANGLQLSIRLDKPKYRLDEPIFLTVLLRNVTNESISLGIHGRMLGTDLKVTDSAGDPLLTRAQAAAKSPFLRSAANTVQNAYIVTIETNHQRRAVINLTNVYALGSGRYSVIATRKFRHEPNGLETYELESKPATLLITDSSGAIPEPQSTVPSAQGTTTSGVAAGENNSSPQTEALQPNQNPPATNAEAPPASATKPLFLLLCAGLLLGILIFALRKKKGSTVRPKGV